MHNLMAVGILVGTAGLSSAAPGPRGKLAIGTPAATVAAFDTKLVTLAIKNNTLALVTCYTKALVKAPELKGTATVTFTVDVSGALIATNAKGLNQEAESCIAATVSKIKLPKPKDGKPVDVTLPLTFEPVAATENPTEMEGGWGYGVSGTGQSSGCGWGTIGTGRYGTLGSVGSRSGYRSPPVPSVSLGQPTVKGDLDKAIIRRYIKRNIQKLTYCYEKQLLVKPTLKGTVTVEFTISADGLVAAAKAAGMKDTDVESCIAGYVKAIEFPKPKNGRAVMVAYPLTFKPSGG